MKRESRSKWATRKDVFETAPPGEAFDIRKYVSGLAKAYGQPAWSAPAADVRNLVWGPDYPFKMRKCLVLQV